MYIEYEDIESIIEYKDIYNCKHKEKYYLEEDIIKAAHKLSGRREIDPKSIRIFHKQRILIFNENHERLI